jgi:hypothetical protein
MTLNTPCNFAEHQLTRRTLLAGLLGGTAGTVGLNGLIQSAVADQLRAAKKQLLIVNQGGGLSQLESWDPKPGTETGGPVRAIPTSVPGVHIAEWLPHTARQVHHLTIVRSLSTGENNHGPADYLMMTGRRQETGLVYPTLGCWANRHWTPAGHGVPGYVLLGQGARESAFLGAQFDAVKVQVDKPIANVDRPAALAEAADLRRHALRQQMNRRFALGRGSADTAAYVQSFDQAMQLMTNKRLFDLSHEPASDADRYGRHEFGRQCLLARRLLEQGVTCVKVIHAGYDTHAENFNVHLDLLDQFDRPFACLIEDLAARRMLEHTLVVAMGEFGRTPQINTRMGRDHWSGSWSAAFAGPRFPAGAVFGRTSADGTEVTDGKVNAPDLFHTLLRALDIDSHATIDVEGQEIPIADPAGKPVAGLLA